MSPIYLDHRFKRGRTFDHHREERRIALRGMQRTLRLRMLYPALVLLGVGLGLALYVAVR